MYFLYLVILPCLGLNLFPELNYNYIPGKKHCGSIKPYAESQKNTVQHTPSYIRTASTPQTKGV